MAAVVTLAASYFTCSRWPMMSAAIASMPASGFSRRSRMTASSWQHIPSTRKTASAWSSQVAQAAGAGSRGSAPAIASRRAAALLHVAQPLTEQREHVLVVERVVNHPPVPAGADDARVAEQPELVRDGGLGDIELRRERGHAQFVARERLEDADPGGIAQHAEDLGQAVDGVGVEWHSLSQL